MKYILAIDQGTTGTTAVLIDANNFRFIDKQNQEFPQIYPRPGEVEHDLNDIWRTVEDTINSLLQRHRIAGDQIACIGITNQRETVCAFDPAGNPLCNAIVWQDRRTSDFCKKLRLRGLERTIRQLTGLPIDPYFSATKMNWLLRNNSTVRAAANSNQLRFGNIDTFLLYKLTNGDSFATDATNASRTLLMNIKTGLWDKKLLKIFSMKENYLPTIRNSFGEFGRTKNLSFLPDGIPISGILGDQQAALFGQAGHKAGEMKCTYGTGSFLLLNTGAKVYRSKAGLLTTIAYKYKGKLTYAIEGSCYITGAAVQWLRDNLKFIGKSAEVETLAREVYDLGQMENILFFPFFTGIGSPHWKAEAKGAILGLTRDTKRSHLARATLDGMALSINDLVEAMRKDTGLKIKTLKVDGGASENGLLLSIQSTILDSSIIRPKIIETTAYGAALAAGIGIELISFKKIDELWQEDARFLPNKSESKFYKQKKKQWKELLKKLYL